MSSQDPGCHPSRLSSLCSCPAALELALLPHQPPQQLQQQPHLAAGRLQGQQLELALPVLWLLWLALQVLWLLGLQPGPGRPHRPCLLPAVRAQQQPHAAGPAGQHH